MNPTYESYDEIVSQAPHAQNNCTRIAYCAVTGQDYATADYIIRETTGKHAPDWMQYLYAYTQMGYNIKLVIIPSSIKTMVGFTRALRDKHTGWAWRESRFLVGTGRLGMAHVVGVANGKVLDWTAERRHRLRIMWEVTETPTGEPGYFDVPHLWYKAWDLLGRQIPKNCRSSDNLYYRA